MSILLSGVILFSVFMFSGCEKESKDKAPELPPLSTMEIDLGEFTLAKKASDTYFNFLTAAFAVGYWNTVLTFSLAVPVVSYAEAFNHEAVNVERNTWKWTYSVNVNDTLYTAELYATLEGAMVNLEMHISQENGFQDFIWYTGTCNNTRTEGQWTLYDNPVNNQAILAITWQRNWDAETFSTRYTITDETSEQNTSYLEYGIEEDTNFDAYYLIYDASETKSFEVNYNTESHEGRVYYDEAWHCWNSDHQDVSCE